MTGGSLGSLVTGCPPPCPNAHTARGQHPTQWLSSVPAVWEWTWGSLHFLQQFYFKAAQGAFLCVLIAVEYDVVSTSIKVKCSFTVSGPCWPYPGFRHVFCGSSCASCALCFHWRWSYLDGRVTLSTSSCWARLFVLQKAWMPLNLWSKTQGSHLGVRKRSLDLETKGSSVTSGSVACELCDSEQIIAPLWVSDLFLYKRRYLIRYSLCLIPIIKSVFDPIIEDFVLNCANNVSITLYRILERSKLIKRTEYIYIFFCRVRSTGWNQQKVWSTLWHLHN